MVAPMLAGMMNCPQATFAANISTLDDNAGIHVEQETDTGTETVKISSLPAVISCDLRLNVPRYATLPNIMKAKKKKIETILVEDMGLDLTPHHDVLEVYDPPPRDEGIMISDVNELLDKLKNEASLIS